MPTSRCAIRRRVNFYEVDSAGIVHFSWYFRYMEEAEYALWRGAGLTLGPTRDIGFPRVAAAFDFKRPLRFDDEVEIAIEVSAMGRTSIGYRATLTRGADLIAIGTMTIVCVTGPPGAAVAVPVPDHIRQALST